MDPASVQPEQVIAQRGGSVLGRKTILKGDHFPALRNKSLQPQIDGAPNYRKVDLLPIHGVAIPTVNGIRNVLEFIGATKNGKQKHVLWQSLREESVIYINGRPFVVREVDHPFSNLEYTGIDTGRVEQMEVRLKEDVLREATRYQNKILVTEELPNGQMVDQWEQINELYVKTPLEVYEELQVEGYLVDYERIPITDTKPPEEQDFDMLVQKILKVDVNTEIIFNCHLGRGRTTTGMVIATLVHLNRTESLGSPRTNIVGKVRQPQEDVFDDIPDSEEALRRGEYRPIQSLIRVLEGGVEGKRQVDEAIDKCSVMQNLREAIATSRNKFEHQTDEKKREAALTLFVESLERYYFLICFAVYIRTDQKVLTPNSTEQSSFVDWMKARPELYSILRRLLRHDPMGALIYGDAKSLVTKKPAAYTDGRPFDIDTIAAMRNGEVLGRQTVLKSDHCPSCQSPILTERVEGAPNFRKVQGFPVYGVASPTVDGIRAVIQKVSGAKGGRPVLWHNTREEPVVYINGKPFVLREVERPYKNMLEYMGIERERVEQMEARLKEDVLREAERYHGAIMVIDETEDGQIFDAWESVNPKVVQTPLEVFRSLKLEGFPIEYARVPITDGKAPQSSDIDDLLIKIASASNDTAFVFNCQMGRGRSTTGTVIACLIKLRIEDGRPLRPPKVNKAFTGEGTDSIGGDEKDNEGIVLAVGSIAPKLEKQNSIARFNIDDIPVVRKITRLFDNGVESREALDAVIDLCAALQNIRQAVLQCWKVFNQQQLEPQVRRDALDRGAAYLERYFKLIAFTAYLNSEAFDGFCQPGTSGILYKAWLHKRPEVQEMKWSIRLRPARFFTAPAESKTTAESDEDDMVLEAIVRARNGSILGKGSILKAYFFPGQKSSSYAEISGVPHVYKVDNFPVYSMATPTADGTKAMLTHLGVISASSGHSGLMAIVIDLREEAVVYVRGKPFVLRELDRPVDPLKYVGIKGPEVEHVEDRLKEDILTEVARSGGHMLLHREEVNPVTNQSDIIGYWEHISPGDIKTPAEVYAALRDGGYNISYKRIPLSREREALPTDVDAIQHQLKSEKGAQYLFISHSGYGGVAYAMAIACLKLKAEVWQAHEGSTSWKTESTDSAYTGNSSILGPKDDEEAFKQGDYRDVLTLTRVLEYGPLSKAEVDLIIDKCGGAGHLRNDIFHRKKQTEKCAQGDDEHRASLLDAGIKALRRYFLLIAFRSYLYGCSALHDTTLIGETGFSAWMQARPELQHLCDNLKLDA